MSTNRLTPRKSLFRMSQLAISLGVMQILLLTPVLAAAPPAPAPRLLDLVEWIVDIVDAVYGFGGILFIVIGVYLGVQWMVSGGDPEKLQDLRQRFTLWVIGFVLFFLSGTIVITIYSILGVYECGDESRGVVKPGFSYLFTECP